MQGFRVCKWRRLQDEADTEFVDFRITRGIGGQQVEINLGTGGEDEPAALGADAGINTELVEFGTFGTQFREIESRSDTNIPAMLVVLVDVAKFDGYNDGTESFGYFFSVKRSMSQRFGKLGTREQVTVSKVSETVADSDVEIPTLGNGAMIVKSHTNIDTDTVVETILCVDTTVGKD